MLAENVLGIDASRCRSGGSVDHLIGILSEANFAAFGFREVHVWVYRALAEKLPKRDNLIVHCPEALEKSLLHQLAWQACSLRSLLKANGVDLLFTADASSLCRFHPAVVLSQDALSYEPGIKEEFGFGKARLRLEAIKLVQNMQFRRADGVMFLTRYAAELIQGSCGRLKDVKIVPHGVHKQFLDAPVEEKRRLVQPIKLVCVSNYSIYKNHWNVVDSLGILRARGYDVELHFAGGGEGPARERTYARIDALGVDKERVLDHGRIAHSELPALIAGSDIFVFASRCETISITLLEGMAMGMPIACSSSGPMPEVLQGAGEFFDPNEPALIADAIEKLITNSERRIDFQARLREIAPSLTWAGCAEKTFGYLQATLERIVNGCQPGKKNRK